MNGDQDWSWMTPGGFDQALNRATPEENTCLRQAASILQGCESAHARAQQWAHHWLTDMRAQSPQSLSLENLLRQYPLHTAEGLALMRMAEALARTPDEYTRRLLLADKLNQGDWDALRQQHHGLAVWMDSALAWAGQQQQAWLQEPAHGLWSQLKDRGIQGAASAMLRRLSHQFIAGVDAASVLRSLPATQHACDALSFDSLGEAARTQADVDAYLHRYAQAIEQIPAGSGHSVSVKLSALHPQFDELHRAAVLRSLPDRVLALAAAAARKGLPLTIDAEEADRLMLTLDVAHAVHQRLVTHVDTDVRHWQGLGLAVQAYQKRALTVIDLLIQHATESGRRWQIRLVKGAYWDTEIVRAQQAGLVSYPVLTSRAATDMNYLACARRLMRERKRIYPMLGTHNALTLACVLSYSQRKDETPDAPYDFECQRLHGMGDALWQAVRQQARFAQLPCRVYTPVGDDAQALSYLIRRLLENGANTSFVNQAVNPDIGLDTLLKDPLETCSQRMFAPAEQLPDPPRLYAPRRNSAGLHLHNRDVQRWARNSLARANTVMQALRAEAETPGTRVDGPDVQTTMDAAHAAALQAAALPVDTRACALEAWADALESHAGEALALLVSEAHKTQRDALAEIREAVDFLRYYAALARQQLAQPRVLAGPAGEQNLYQLKPRGVWLCISPWNFPLAIFVGQVATALVCGNAVLAKPAEQTPLIARWAVALAHEVGIGQTLLQLLPADRQHAAAWLHAKGLAGVSFTGSNASARRIRLALAEREGPGVPLVAETGGMNAMVVDSTALLEQAAEHIVDSAFNMAGQRCSALRVLYVQDDILAPLTERLTGMVTLLQSGSPDALDCDLPPLIDSAALQRLQAQWQRLRTQGDVLIEPQFTERDGLAFCTPGLIRLQQPVVDEELFGPIVQIVPYAATAFDRVLKDITTWGWGLTAGLQSRIDSRHMQIRQLPVGNVYINRPMIGATVGVQPFGGQGLSGTGPKAGGPDSLRPYCTEQLVSINTAAAGGAMELLTLPDDPVKLANRFGFDD